MKLVILAVFLFVVAVASLPVEQPKEKAVAVEASPKQAQDKEGADDLKAEETFWGWGKRYYGGWGGGYYAPRYYGGWWGNYGYPSSGWVRTYWY